MAKAPTSQDAPTEIYLPDFHFPDSHTAVTVSDGKWAIEYEVINSVKLKLLRWWHGRGGQEIRIQGLKRKREEYTKAPNGEDMKGGCTVM